MNIILFTVLHVRHADAAAAAAAAAVDEVATGIVQRISQRSSLLRATEDIQMLISEAGLEAQAM